MLNDCVADLGMGLTINLARDLVAQIRDSFAPEDWARAALATKLGGATMEIVGLGRIGKAVARRAEAFGMRIVYYGQRRVPDTAYPYRDDLAVMARDSDYLMLTCPGGEAVTAT